MLAYHPIDWNSVDLLDIVEAYAEAECYSFKNTICSEKALSELFDWHNEDWLHENRDDQTAIDEFFNNWTDMLCTSGELHPEQYDKYTYVGKYCE